MKLFGYTIISTKQLDKILSEFASTKKTLRQLLNDWVEDWQLADPNTGKCPIYEPKKQITTNKQKLWQNLTT